MNLPPRWQWKLDRWREQIAAVFRSEPREGRPRLCPACGRLVGSRATKCHECGASLTFSLAAMSRRLLSLLPETSPITYLILGTNSLLFLASLMATVSANQSFSLFGGIRGDMLLRLGARQSLLILGGELWRLVIPIFLHGSLMHFAMNTIVLMDLGPQIEEVYGSARYLFLYVATGIFSFLVSTAWSLYRFGDGGLGIGASGALMGLIGLLLAIATRRGGAAMQALRSQLIRWVVYIFIFGFVLGGTDNAAHLGGLAAGFVLGKIFVDRDPVTAEERKRAYALGWLAAIVVVGSLAAMLAAFSRAR